MKSIEIEYTDAFLFDGEPAPGLDLVECRRRFEAGVVDSVQRVTRAEVKITHHASRRDGGELLVVRTGLGQFARGLARAVVRGQQEAGDWAVTEVEVDDARRQGAAGG